MMERIEEHVEEREMTIWIGEEEIPDSLITGAAVRHLETRKWKSTTF